MLNNAEIVHLMVESGQFNKLSRMQRDIAFHPNAYCILSYCVPLYSRLNWRSSGITPTQARKTVTKYDYIKTAETISKQPEEAKRFWIYFPSLQKSKG
jgi:hypothetical protein